MCVVRCLWCLVRCLVCLVRCLMCLLQRSMHSMRFGAVVDVVGVVLVCLVSCALLGCVAVGRQTTTTTERRRYLLLSRREFVHRPCNTEHCTLLRVPASSPSRGGDVAVYVFLHKPTELAHSFLSCSCVYFCLYGPFTCISFHQFSRQLSAFSLCSSYLKSAL